MPTNGFGYALTEHQRPAVATLEGEAHADLAEAIRELASQIRELTAAGALAAQRGREGDAEVELRRIVHDLVESLDELETDNAKLHAENNRLASQHPVPSSLLVPEAPIDTAPAPVPNDRLLALVEENARLRDALARAQADAAEIRAVLRSLDTSRAWKIVSLYWSLARRFGRARSAASIP